MWILRFYLIQDQLVSTLDVFGGDQWLVLNFLCLFLGLASSVALPSHFLASLSEFGLVLQHITFWFGSVPNRPTLKNIPATLNTHVHLYASSDLVGSVWYERRCRRPHI